MDRRRLTGTNCRLRLPTPWRLETARRSLVCSSKANFSASSSTLQLEGILPLFTPICVPAAVSLPPSLLWPLPGRLDGKSKEKGPIRSDIQPIHTHSSGETVCSTGPNNPPPTCRKAFNASLASAGENHTLVICFLKNVKVLCYVTGQSGTHPQFPVRR